MTGILGVWELQQIAQHLAKVVVVQEQRSPWLKREDAAIYLHVSQGTLERWARSGRGPQYCKRYGVLRYHIGDIDRWLSQCHIKPSLVDSDGKVVLP